MVVSKRWTRRFEDNHRCPRCGEVKPIDAFYAEQSKSNGRRFICKACDLARAKDHYRANRDQRLAAANCTLRTFIRRSRAIESRLTKSPSIGGALDHRRHHLPGRRGPFLEQSHSLDNRCHLGDPWRDLLDIGRDRPRRGGASPLLLAALVRAASTCTASAA